MKIVLQCVPERVEKAMQRVNSAGISCDIYVDKEKKGPFQGFVDCLHKYPSGDEYRLSMQDDLIYSEGFVDYLPHLEREMREKEIHLLSLYSPRKNNVIKAYESGKRYWKSFSGFTTVCTIFSPHLVGLLLDYAPHYTGSQHDDWFVAATCQMNKVKTFVHLPSIVQHDLEIKSSLGHAWKTRSGPRSSPAYEADFITRWKSGAVK